MLPSKNGEKCLKTLLFLCILPHWQQRLITKIDIFSNSYLVLDAIIPPVAQICATGEKIA
jgi:hypothetical protein